MALRDDHLLTEDEVEPVPVIVEHILEVVAEGVGVAVSLIGAVGVAGCRYVLVSSRVSYVVGGEAVEAVR